MGSGPLNIDFNSWGALNGQNIILTPGFLKISAQLRKDVILWLLTRTTDIFLELVSPVIFTGLICPNESPKISAI